MERDTTRGFPVALHLFCRWVGYLADFTSQRCRSGESPGQPSLWDSGQTPGGSDAGGGGGLWGPAGRKANEARERREGGGEVDGRRRTREGNSEIVADAGMQ